LRPSPTTDPRSFVVGAKPPAQLDIAIIHVS
jgi:hypothetical protein